MEFHVPILEEAKQNLIARVQAHPFLRRCRDGTVALEELKVFLVQHGIYGNYFTRYLCALMGNMRDGVEVRRLAENLCEELGLTPDSATPHSAVYRTMLDEFGLTIDGQRPLLGTRRLIDTMFDHCRDPNPARGLGALCLGAEALVPNMYADIITAFGARGISATSLQFFHMHVECDDGHADTLRDIMIDLAGRDPEQLPLMLNAGTAMVDARLDFFTSIELSYRLATPPETFDASADLVGA